MVEVSEVCRRLKKAGCIGLGVFSVLGILLARDVYKEGRQRQSTKPEYSVIHSLIQEKERAKIYLESYTFEDFKREPQWLDIRREDFNNAKSNLESYVTANPQLAREYKFEPELTSDKLTREGKVFFKSLLYGSVGSVALGTFGSYLFGRRKDKN